MVEVTELNEAQLEEEGWQRRSILDEPRLSEVTRMYEDMGLEVLARELDPGEIKHIDSCIECGTGQLMVVYTRPKEDGKTKDELFD